MSQLRFYDAENVNTKRFLGIDRRRKNKWTLKNVIDAENFTRMKMVMEKSFNAIRLVLCAEDAVAYIDSHYNRESYDFCPECYKELKAFVDKRIDS